MSIKMTVKGIDISVDSTDDAVRLINALTQQPAQAVSTQQAAMKVKSKPSAPAKPAAAAAEESDHEVALKLLSALTNETSGMPSDKVMALLKVKNVKGIGSKTGRINKLIEKVGFRRSAVYRNDKDNTGHRVWKAGEQARAAITAIVADELT